MGEPCADGSVRSTRWGIVAFNVIHDKQLSIGARMVYTSMATRAARNGQLQVCQLTMAKDIGRSRAWVNAGAQELEACGLIRVERRYVGRIQCSSRYVLLDGLRSAGAEATDSGSVGKTTTAPAGELEDQGDGPDETMCQPAAIRDGQPTARAADQHAARRQLTAASRQRADTSHESQIHIPLPDGRVRANRSMDPGLAAHPVNAPAIDPGWRPGEDDMAWARARMPDLDIAAYTENFVLTCLAKGYRYADPSFGWRLWIADPKKPLPTLAFKPQTPISGDSSHDRFDIKFQASGDFPSGQRKIFRNHAGGQRKNFNGESGSGQGSGDLRDLNASRAAACLGRLLERRAPGASS
jgi:hypothetical protein